MKKNLFKLFAILMGAFLVTFIGCKKDEEDPGTDPGTSATELLVKKFTAAPAVDGTIDDMWSTCQTLSSSAEVPTLAARGTYLNSDGEGIEETLGLFYPYSGDQINFNMRGGSPLKK